MKYYEIRDYDAPILSNVHDGYRTRVIDENELDRRINVFRQSGITLDDCKHYLLHGKVKEVPDPWVELVHELSDALGFIPGKPSTLRLEAALLKLKGLVEKKN